MNEICATNKQSTIMVFMAAISCGSESESILHSTEVARYGRGAAGLADSRM